MWLDPEKNNLMFGLFWGPRKNRQLPGRELQMVTQRQTTRITKISFNKSYHISLPFTYIKPEILYIQNRNTGGRAAMAFLKCFRPLALRPILSGGLPFSGISF